MNRDRKRLIRVLQGSIGETGTETIVRYVDLTLKENNENMFNTRFETLATKEELANVRGEMKEGFAKVRGEMSEGFAAIRGETKEVGFEAQTGTSRLELYIAKIKGELEVKISEFKSDILRWMFAFFVTMLLAILGLYFKK